MVKQQTWTYSVTIRDDSRGQGDWPGFLDMLRYDRAVVETWSHSRDDGTYTIKMSGTRAPTVDRWRSFGLVVKEVR